MTDRLGLILDFPMLQTKQRQEKGENINKFPEVSQFPLSIHMEIHLDIMYCKFVHWGNSRRIRSSTYKTVHVHKWMKVTVRLQPNQVRETFKTLNSLKTNLIEHVFLGRHGTSFLKSRGRSSCRKRHPPLYAYTRQIRRKSSSS